VIYERRMPMQKQIEKMDDPIKYRCHGKHKDIAHYSQRFSAFHRNIRYHCSICGAVCKDPKDVLGPWCIGCRWFGEMLNGIKFCLEELA